MIIYPAIDLRDGKCVRLYKGDFATTKIYNTNPAEVLTEFAAAGSGWLHLVDLDGAKIGKTLVSEINDKSATMRSKSCVMASLSG